jgi:hypothetical protein
MIDGSWLVVGISSHAFNSFKPYLGSCCTLKTPLTTLMRCCIFEPTRATFGEIHMCHMEDIYLVFYLVDVVSTLGCSHVPHGAFIALDGMT